MGAKVTRTMVEMAYQLFLGRQPENEKVIVDALSYPDVESLRAAFVRSDEFKGCFQRLAGQARMRVPLDTESNDVEIEVSKDEFTALLSHVETEWSRLGREQPHWSVLSVDQFKPEQISATESNFFATGFHDTTLLLNTLARNGFDHKKLERVFEFGCGVGRVTVHLAHRFEKVIGCDISPSHLAIAEKTVATAYLKNVRLHLAQIRDLGMELPFDLWFSRIVLQHNPPPIMAMILRRALTLLSAGGAAVFQVPTYAVGYNFYLKKYLSQLPSGIEMHVLPQSEVFRIAKDCNCDVLEIREDEAVGNEHVWLSNQFVLRKRS